MPRKRLKSYKLGLNHEQIADGMNAANRNACRLCEDAQLLLDAKRYASAACLAILSIEESGKRSILRRIAIATTHEELLRLWKNYRTHTKKNILWPVPILVRLGARQLDDFKTVVQSKGQVEVIIQKAGCHLPDCG